MGEDDVTGLEVVLVAALLAALLAVATWRALDALNAPAGFTTSTTTTSVR